MVDRYRTILSADPTSMVFVELAKALIDQGDLDEAVRVCEAGVRQHPESIVGQVLWGRALLGQGDPEAAMDHFDSAVALDPENPYAYNLIGEALLHQQLYRSALPLLRKAVSLQPGDSRVRQWLEQAEAAVGDARGASLGADATTVTPALPEEGDASDEGPTTEGPPPAGMDAAFDAVFGELPGSTPGGGAGPLDGPTRESPTVNLDAVMGAGDAVASPFADPFDAAFGAVGAGNEGPGDATEVLVRPPPEAMGEASPPVPGGDGGSPFADYFDAAFGRVDSSALPESEDGIIPGMTQTFTALELEEAGRLDRERMQAAAAQAGSVTPGGPDLRDPTIHAAPPPLPPPLPGKGGGPPPPPREEASELFGLKLPPSPAQLKAEAEAKAAAAKAEAKAKAGGGGDTAHALAAEYERELRARLMPDEQPRGFFQRNSKLLLVGGAVSLALLTAAVATLYARAANRKEAIAEGLTAAHNGIARDSYQAYLAALEALEEVVDLDPKNVEAKALTAQIEAILYAELDPDPARRERASKLVADAQVGVKHPDLALDARYHLLPPDARGPVGEEIVQALEKRPESALLHYLAGRHRLSQGKAKEATGHFEKALKLEPGHARTVLELARYLGSLGKWKSAESYYDNLRSNFPGHVRARIGVARAKVERKDNLDGALSVLELVESEQGANLAPEESVALEAVFGQVLEARGQHAEAVARLEAASKAHPRRAGLAFLLARTRAKHFELPEALAAIERAIAITPQDVEMRELQAQILIDWGRYDDALAMLKGVGGKAPELLLQKARAAYHAGKLTTARKTLESMRNDAGQMPADAAIYLALVDAESSEIDRGRAVLDRAAKARKNDPLTLWALGRLNIFANQPATATRYFEKALARDDRYFRAAVDNAVALRASKKDGPAMEAVSAGLDVNPHFREGRLLLGELHLAADEFEPARDLFRKVIADHPKEASAHRGLADALLALDDLEAGEQSAQEAMTLQPKDPRVLHTLGRAQLANGKAPAAVQTLLKARRLDAENAELLADLGWAYLEQGGKNRAKQAKTYFEEALELSKGSTRARWGLGRAQLRLDDKEAIASLTLTTRALRKTAPVAERAEAWLDLGKAYLEVGRKPDPKGARRALTASLEAKDLVSTRLLLGRVLMDDNKAKAAVSILERAIEAEAENAEAHLALGQARAAAGDIEGARAALDRSLVLSPKGKVAAEARKALSSL
ncbi:MAG: tetratricopeptide repeat protein [Deltaproteobacteria bacterium]|nr:tetratricopeptide repeat protein [Deltaproteobacteria bacterium]